MHRAVNMPGRAIGPVLQALKDQLPLESYQTLAEYHMDVVRSLKGEAEGNTAAAAATLQVCVCHHLHCCHHF